CNNIGPEHRRQIYPTLQRWFDMAPPQKEYQKRHAAADLECLTPEAMAVLKPRQVYELAAELGRQRAAEARKRQGPPGSTEQRLWLRKEWSRLLGEVEPTVVTQNIVERQTIGDLVVEKRLLEYKAVRDKGAAGETKIVVPLLLLRPAAKKEPTPVVLAVAQAGKQAFLKN